MYVNVCPDLGASVVRSTAGSQWQQICGTGSKCALQKSTQQTPAIDFYRQTYDRPCVVVVVVAMHDVLGCGVVGNGPSRYPLPDDAVSRFQMSGAACETGFLTTYNQ